MKFSRTLPLAGIACLLVQGGIVFAQADLPPAVQMEHDLIDGTHQENLKKARQPLADLGAKYTTALEKRKAAVQAEGKLESVLLVQGAIDSFAAGNLPGGESADPELAKLGKVYLEQHAKLEDSLRPALAEAWNLHRRKLDSFVTRLTKDGKIEEAKAVREEIAGVDSTIEGLAKKGAKPEIAKSPKELLLSKTWKVKPEGGRSYDVKFEETGKAKRVEDDTAIWKWKLEEDGTLMCHWLSGGFVKFEFADPAASKFSGTAKSGTKYTMTAKD